MSERYWITGVQLGMLKAPTIPHSIIDGVVKDQFIGNFPTDKDKERFERQMKKVK
jgi:hypothetical protein